jgi:hypothetical protein
VAVKIKSKIKETLPLLTVLLSTFKYIYEALGITSNEEEPFTMDF